MRTFSAFFASLLVGLTLAVAGISDAEARRMGGGKSFGGKSTFSSPARQASPPAAGNERQRYLS